jgi:hypothetical protein
MKTFTFELKGYCFNFECETWEQFEQALVDCDIIPTNYGELVYSKEITDE